MGELSVFDPGPRASTATALESLRAAVPIADALIGAPARWGARAALGQAAYALGDDETSETAWNEVVPLVRDFAATLSAERRSRFLSTPQVESLLRADAGSPV